MNKIGNHTAISEVSTLLVLRHSNNSIGIVQGIEHNGNLIDVPPIITPIHRIVDIIFGEDFKFISM